ncbi:MAG: hypothetical protein ACR2OR_05450 [Hyphomicrobiales bacterium]
MGDNQNSIWKRWRSAALITAGAIALIEVPSVTYLFFSPDEAPYSFDRKAVETSAPTVEAVSPKLPETAIAAEIRTSVAQSVSKTAAVEAVKPGDLENNEQLAKKSLVDQLVKAKYGFNKAESMVVGEVVDVALYISTDKSFDAPALLFGLPGAQKSGELKVSSHVSANLHGSAFKVTLKSKERQLISQTLPANWTWTVEAMEPGEKQLLTLEVYAYLENQGRLSDPISVRTLKENIEVNVSWYSRTASFLASIWQLLVGALALLLATGVGIVYQRRGS